MFLAKADAVTQFDFGPAIDQEKLKGATDELLAAQQDLGMHMKALRDSQMAYSKSIREGGDIDLDKEFYHRAYIKFINYFKVNMEIEFNQKDPTIERSLSSDKFEIRDSEFTADAPPDRVLQKIKKSFPKNC